MTPIPPPAMQAPARIILPLPVLAQRFGCWTWGEALDIAQAIWPEVPRVRLELNFQALGATARDLIQHLPRLARFPDVRGIFEYVMFTLAETMSKAKTTFGPAMSYLASRFEWERISNAVGSKPHRRTLPARRRPRGGRR